MAINYVHPRRKVLTRTARPGTTTVLRRGESINLSTGQVFRRAR